MLTPLDIQNKEFAKGIRGYSEREVDDFLALVVKAMEDLIQVNIDTTARVTALEDELKRYKAMEKTINDAIVLAQKTSEDMIQNAREKSDYVLERADDQAKKIITDANTEVLEILKRHEAAKHEFKAFQMRFKTLLEAQMKTVDEMIE
ncbi:MAG: cell division initiation protein [Clostridiales bacterium]|jgi:cell division initiation protein|nr:cell division initiation protein [Clostridiales bacterium]